GAVCVADTFEPLLQLADEMRHLLAALPVVAEFRKYIEAERRLRAANVSGLVELYRLVGVLEHPRGLDPKAVVERLFYRLDAAVEHAQIRFRHRRRVADLVTDQTDDRRDVGRGAGDCIGDERAEADVIAADREQNEINRALAALRRTPALAENLFADGGRTLRIHWQPIARRAAARRAVTANEFAELLELRRHALFRIRPAHLLARLGGREQALGNIGAGAGQADESDGAMAIFQRHAHADAERVAVLRAVAIGTEPLRAAAIERVAEFARVRLVDQPLFFILHDALRQRLGIELVGRGDFVVRHLVLLAGPHGGEAAQVHRVVEHLPRVAHGDRPVR